MKYKELFQEENEQIKERYELVLERIRSIGTEESVNQKYRDFFVKAAEFILQTAEIYEQKENGGLDELALDELKALNQKLYGELLADNYETCYGNPAYAVQVLGAVHGKLLCVLYAELRGMIVYAYEGRKYLMTIFMELFIEIYNCLEEEQETAEKQLNDIFYWFMSDYSDVLAAQRVEEQINPAYSFAAEIIMEADLTDVRYLYRFGEYISENELQMAEYLSGLDDEMIKLIADTYTEGYRIGFVKGNKDLSKKCTVNIRYPLGFERVVREAVNNFHKMGLEPVIYRAAVSSINRRGTHRIGYSGGVPNKQYDFDHKADQALYMDKAFIERKLSVIRNTYEKNKELAGGFAGPAVIETFGEVPFAPISKAEAYSLDDKQKKISVYFDNESAQITNSYIKGEERSFTIIAFPLPEIGADFTEIFEEVIKINTLDYAKYEKIQQYIIDALDQGDYVRVVGKDGNLTDLRIRLAKLSVPDKETRFENCVADVNIPVGEVFTSPVLQGTQGRLHVKEVYLNELNYKNITLDFKDGKITDYTCSNFTDEAENKKYILENVLFNHETLPMGEFAIGTNTTAYAAAKKYQIADKLPILIAEKMGPHFAVGDTCYSWSEDIPVFNPDGKEIIAKDNEQSRHRKEDVSKAYFNCHTDITIPYEELKGIYVVKADGTKTTIIEDGRFVLSGTEELNEPLIS